MRVIRLPCFWPAIPCSLSVTRCWTAWRGLGTGKLRESYDAVVAGGGRFYLSGGSSSSRDVTDRDQAGKPAQFAGPQDLVRLALEHDRMFSY